MLLREFPKIRRAALSGQTVIVHTREGDLKITAAPSEVGGIVGCMKGRLRSSDGDIDEPTTGPEEWSM
jgi:hypothetical protein